MNDLYCTIKELQNEGKQSRETSNMNMYKQT